MPPPAGGLERVYDEDERLIIDPFKKDYLNATSPGARKRVTEAFILPKLFEHWAKIGKPVPQDETEARTKVKFFELLFRFHLQTPL